MPERTFLDHSTLVTSYLQALTPCIAECLAWWSDIRSSVGAELVARHWPAGPASHPRCLAIFGEFYLACIELNARNDGPPPDPRRADDESAWGVENEDDIDDDRPADQLHPVDLLILELEDVDNELYEHMLCLSMTPVGLETEVDLSLNMTNACTFDGLATTPVQPGLERLLMAPNDVRPPDQVIHADPASITAEHAQLFHAYRAHLHLTLLQTQQWWAGIVSVRGSVEAAYLHTPVGPVVDPHVIGVIRAYWLACEAINATLPLCARVAPERMLLAWLVDGRHDSWVRLLTAMPYWPIGLDAEGRWV